MDELLRRQWQELRDWLRGQPLSRHLATETGLGDWTVGDLVAHLGLSLSFAVDVHEAAGAEATLSTREYVAAYPPAAEEIAELTRLKRAELGGDLVAGVDAIAQRALASLEAFDGEYVAARRGPIRREDYLVTRLIEMVVHGDDLWRVLGGDRSPVLPEALDVVGAALAEAYREKTGAPPDVPSPIAWVRVACGRVPSDDPALPLL